MTKVGGNKNFGYGKTMAYAGHKVLQDIYRGHFGTVAAHRHRWESFVTRTRATGAPRDGRHITTATLLAYGLHLQGRVYRGEIAVRYAQNLLSTVNVVIGGMRGDRRVWIAPSQVVGTRVNTRSAAPAALINGSGLNRALNAINASGHDRASVLLELNRAFGLRLKEAALLNIGEALAQARTHGAIDVREGTKGGRGRHIERWVPCTPQGLRALERAQVIARSNRNLVPAGTSLKVFMDHVHRVALPALRAEGLGTIHDLRAAYACQRYHQLTGQAAPVVAGRRQASVSDDRKARDTIARELGHGRRDVAAAYLGSAR